jgi:hypothetical protein
MKKRNNFMSAFIIAISFLLFFCLTPGCAVHSNILPLGKGNMEANFSLGGPFIPLTNPKIPTPYAVAGVNYGLSDRINLEGNFHITSAFYKVAGFDIGAAYFPILNERYVPAVGIQPRLLLFSSLKSDVVSRFRIYPLISGSAAWEWGNGFIYSGIDMIIPFTRPDYRDEYENVIFSPFLGYKWDIGSSFNLFTEVKWHGANVKSNMAAVQYVDINRYGALALLFSVSRRF